MKALTVDQIRDRFLDFFVEKQHYLLPSYPLVPHGDNSLLLINSGMAPMKAFFAGQEKPPSARVATCQKCIRTTDIDEVGKDARHGSFFEMLGNFSFGDYFKREVIPWAWEFLTDKMEIPADKLLISVYEEDDEAYEIWHNTIGIPADRIFKLDKNENFWEHGNGPCGPCSEIHFDRGAENGCGKPDCTVGCDCDRFMEIWNLVFTQFEKKEDGSYVPLKTANIDTGMGLERLAIVMQNAPSIFDIDNIKGIRAKVLSMAKKQNGQRPFLLPTSRREIAEQFPGIEQSKLTSANIIADHVRSVTFMAADGVLPSNEGRGYILRRLLRRAVRHGQALGIKENFVTAIAQASIEAYSHAYPNLSEKSDHIIQVLGSEENRFMETLDTGMNLLQKHIDALKKSNAQTLGGGEAFKLYDTFGFPPDLTREILEDNGLSWDEEGFIKEMQDQKNRARAARGVANYMGADETIYHRLPPNLPTEFVGYTENECEAEILALIAENEVVDEAAEGQNVAIVLNRTPFYAASGGQKGDTGEIGNTVITDCITVAGNNTVHLGTVAQGSIKVGDRIKAEISTFNRKNTAANHSATHLLQKALKDVLGGHVEQKGSEVTPERLRFDFTHNAPLTAKQRDEVAFQVNLRIRDNIPVEITETTPDEARKQGAVALFGEKYGQIVRMVKMGNQSTELCGGTHVKSTGEILEFLLFSESGIASGVRRIEAATGQAAITTYREAYKTLQAATEICKLQSPSDLPTRLNAILAENKELKKEAEKAKQAASGQQQGTVAQDLIKNAETKDGITLISAKLENYGIEALRQLCDKLKAELKTESAMLLCGINPETNAAMFLCSATDGAVKKGINAGQIVKESATICGGGGGGKPNHAQAGGKDASKADDAIKQALIRMKEMI